MGMEGKESGTCQREGERERERGGGGGVVEITLEFITQDFKKSCVKYGNI